MGKNKSTELPIRFWGCDMSISQQFAQCRYGIVLSSSPPGSRRGRYGGREARPWELRLCEPNGTAYSHTRIEKGEEFTKTVKIHMPKIKNRNIISTSNSWSKAGSATRIFVLFHTSACRVSQRGRPIIFELSSGNTIMVFSA